MAAIAKFGAALGVDELTKSVEKDKTVEVAVWKNKSGVDVKHHPFNPTTKFNVAIGGDATGDYDTGVVGSLPLTGLAGGSAVVESVKYNETQDGGAETSISGTHRPSASAL